MTHHHLLVLLLLLLDHQQLVVVLLLLLTEGVVALRTVIRRVDHAVVRAGQVEGLLVTPGRVVHAHSVLLLILLAHLLHALHGRLIVLLLIGVVLMAVVVLLLLLLSLLLLGVDGGNVEFLVAETWRVKCLIVHFVAVRLEIALRDT